MSLKTTLKTPPFEVSRQQKIGFLYDTQDLKELLELFKDIYCIDLTRPGKPSDLIIAFSELLPSLENNVASLKKNQSVSLSSTDQRLLNSSLSSTTDAIAELKLADGRSLLRPTLPLIQINPLRLYYSQELASIKSQVYGSDTIAWGIQLSYPQLFKDQGSGDVISTLTPDSPLPNTALFKALQKWMRRNTKICTFKSGDMTISSNVRITPRALEWASSHPQLKEHNLHLA